MNIKVILLFLVGLCITQEAVAQKSAKKIKVAADEYYQKKKYFEAYNLYSKYLRLKAPDQETLKKMGRAALLSNHVEESIKFYESILQDTKKPNKDIYYELAIAYHHKRDYKKAILYYKTFLAETKFDHELRESVKDNILRCATGWQLSYVDELAVVENMGDKVNSKGDDYGPILSPNYNNKLYFTSNREGSTGGMRNEKGQIDNKYGTHRSDIYSSTVINGEWTATTPLPALLNTAKHERLLDFNDNGQVLFYYQGIYDKGGKVLIDSFNAVVEKLYPAQLDTPFDAAKGDVSLFFFNDSTLLFSSNGETGIGGKDIYICRKENGYWLVPKNLGSTINTPYDELSPFLAKDGRTLYFSSNNPKSMGGYDIFRSKYNDAKEEWEKPENLAWPINSSGSNKDFKISATGLESYFSSNRKSGEGAYDLYTAYFKSKLFENTVQSNPIVFLDVPAYRNQQESAGVVFEADTPPPVKSYPSTEEYPSSQITTIEVNPIHFRDDDDVMNLANTKRVGEIIRIMNAYPQLKIMLIAHSDGSDPAKFDRFFSIKRAEKVARYMKENGINPANIYLKGLGNTYPAALQETEQGYSEAGAKLNKRIDFYIFNSAGLPLNIKNNGPKVSTFLEDVRGKQYGQAIKGLSYKVQIASLQQRYKGNALDLYDDPSIESIYKDQTYQYTVGLFQNFYAAEQLRKKLVLDGITDAFVVPYINGVKASREDSKVYASAYPDLLNFLTYTDNK